MFLKNRDYPCILLHVSGFLLLRFTVLFLTFGLSLWASKNSEVLSLCVCFFGGCSPLRKLGKKGTNEMGVLFVCVSVCALTFCG